VDGKREGIGDLYHQETKYRRESMRRGGLDWAHQPPPYKEFAHALNRFPIRPLYQKGGKSLWKWWIEGDPSGIFPINPLPLVSFLK